MLISDLYDKVLIAQDSVIDLMEQRNELKKILNTIDGKINKWDLKVKEYKEDIDKINKESSLLDNYFSGFGFYESEEEKALAIQKDKNLQIFTYNQKNKDYIESVKNLSKNI